MRRRSPEERYQDMLQKFKEGQARTGKRKKRQRGTEKQKEYNRSEAGKARRKRWRRSAEGKAKLRERYEERKLWLDELKAKAGCLSCGESNPRVLCFYPRDPQKIKFPPILQNASRSLGDWLKVIKACDVFCLNCLGRKKTSRKGPQFRARLPQVKRLSQKGRKIRGNGRSPEKVKTKAPHEALTINSKIECSTCRLKFIPKRRNKTGRAFCSSRCRLLFWAVRKIFELYSSGWGDGLKKIISELAEVKR